MVPMMEPENLVDIEVKTERRALRVFLGGKSH